MRSMQRVPPAVKAAAMNGLRALVEEAHGLDQLDYSNIVFPYWGDVAPAADTQFAELLSMGMPLLDALIWRQGRQEEQLEATRQDGAVAPSPLTTAQAGRLAVRAYFNIVTQARTWPAKEGSFILKVMNDTMPTDEASRLFSSFPADLLGHEWVMHVPLSGLPVKLRNRLSLGMAGHRLVSAFRFIRSDDIIDHHAEFGALSKALLTMLDGRSWWDLHPSFRTVEVVSALKSLNGLLSTALAMSVNPDRLRALAVHKIIFAVPEADPRYEHWTNVDGIPFPQLQDPFE